MIAVEGRTQQGVVEILAQTDDLAGGLGDMPQMGIERDPQAATLGDRQQRFDVAQDGGLAVQRGLHGQFDQLHPLDGFDDPADDASLRPSCSTA